MGPVTATQLEPVSLICDRYSRSTTSRRDCKFHWWARTFKMSEDKTPAQNGGIVSDRRRHGLRPNLLDTQRDTPAYRARIGAIFGRSSHYPPDE